MFPLHSLVVFALSVAENPIHGSPYVCSLNLTLYTHAGHNGDVAAELEANAAQLAAAGEAHQKIVRHPRDNSFYMITEPGDEKYDVGDGSAGVCTDVHVAYGSTGCPSNGASKAIMTLTNSVGRYIGWSMVLCGAMIEHEDSDFVTGSSISASSLVYPRTLVRETQVNGQTEQAITCWNPFNCMTKCNFFSTNARDNGLPSPAACSLCKPPIPDNTVTTIVELISAIRHDIISTLRLVAICVNPAACACQVLMMLKPAWIDNLESPVEKCSSASDVMVLIMDRILVDMVRTAEGLVNNLIDSVNKVIGWVGKINNVCWEYKTFKRCPEDADSLAALFGCSPDDDELHKRCYYECAPPPLFGLLFCKTPCSQTHLAFLTLIFFCAGVRRPSVWARPAITTTTPHSSIPRRPASSSSSLQTLRGAHTNRFLRHCPKPLGMSTPPTPASTRRLRRSATAHCWTR
jgi:hypothetical protein